MKSNYNFLCKVTVRSRSDGKFFYIKAYLSFDQKYYFAVNKKLLNSTQLQLEYIFWNNSKVLKDSKKVLLRNKRLNELLK